jgi:hypothetical protein
LCLEREAQEKKKGIRGQRSRYPEEMSSEMSQARSAVGSRPKSNALQNIFFSSSSSFKPSEV